MPTFCKFYSQIIKRLSEHFSRLESQETPSRHAIMDVEEAERQALYVGYQSRKEEIEQREFMKTHYPKMLHFPTHARRGAIMDPKDYEFFAQISEGIRPVALPPQLTEETSRNKLILFRGDNRPPRDIFVSGFSPQETSVDKTIPISHEEVGPHRYMPMLQPPLALGAGMDIESQYNVCLTPLARVACLFPLEASNPTYLYCIYIPSDLIYKTYDTQRAVVAHIGRCAQELEELIKAYPAIQPGIEAIWVSTETISNPRARLISFAQSINSAPSIANTSSEIKEKLYTILSYMCSSVATSQLLFSQEVCAIIPISSDFIAFAIPFEKQKTISNPDDGYSVNVKFQRIMYNDRFRSGQEKAQELFGSLRPFAHHQSSWQIKFAQSDPIFNTAWMSALLSDTPPPVRPSLTPTSSLRTPPQLPEGWKPECPHIRGLIASTLTGCICHLCPDPCANPTHPHRTP